MKEILLIALVLCGSKLIAQNNDTDIRTIRKLLDQQQQAWNKASLEDFMLPYWHDDSLMFIGKNGIKYGWHNTLDNYKKSYPTPGAMGQLSFKLIKIEQQSEGSIFVIGKWELQRQAGNLSGHFTLLWKKIRGEWVIVADHSS